MAGSSIAKSHEREKRRSNHEHAINPRQRNTFKAQPQEGEKGLVCAVGTHRRPGVHVYRLDRRGFARVAIREMDDVGLMTTCLLCHTFTTDLQPVRGFATCVACARCQSRLKPVHFCIDFRSPAERLLDRQREDEMEIDEIDDANYRQFARVYPHECFDNDPERFWQFYHSANPDVSRADMERALKDTRE
jgi:hypothetical protein